MGASNTPLQRTEKRSTGTLVPGLAVPQPKSTASLRVNTGEPDKVTLL